jgi:type II secretory pathway component PulF
VSRGLGDVYKRHGLNVSSSLSILENATRDLYYKERLSKMKDFVEKGDQISVAMKQVGGFPPMMLRMIMVGENSGTLDNQLKYLAGEYADRLKQIVSTISEIIKPLIIVIAGGVFLFLIVALMLPVYDLVKQSMSMSR